jgi:hypothetical protein
MRKPSMPKLPLIAAPVSVIPADWKDGRPAAGNKLLTIAVQGEGFEPSRQGFFGNALRFFPISVLVKPLVSCRLSEEIRLINALENR